MCKFEYLHGQVRTLRDAVETKYGKRLDGNSVAIPWMVMNVAGILNRSRVGMDGGTAYQRVKGKEISEGHR